MCAVDRFVGLYAIDLVRRAADLAANQAADQDTGTGRGQLTSVAAERGAEQTTESRTCEAADRLLGVIVALGTSPPPSRRSKVALSIHFLLIPPLLISKSRKADERIRASRQP